MKKLVSICLILCLIGGAFALGGFAAGGVLYGSYYNGRLYPIHEIVRDVSYELRRNWHWGDYNYDYDDDHYRYNNSTPARSVPVDGNATPTTTISKLHLDLGLGQFRLVSGDSVAVEGGKIEQSDLDSDEWTLKVRSKLGRADEEIIIAIPPVYYEEIEIALGASKLTVDVPLAADKIELSVGAAAFYTTEPINTLDLELAVGAGSVDALLASEKSAYGWEATTAGGSVTLNGAVLISGLFGSTSDRNRAAPRQLEIALGAGSVALTTVE